MVQTALIAFILIGMMFLFTGEKKEHVVEETKIEVHDKKVDEHHADDKHTLMNDVKNNHNEVKEKKHSNVSEKVLESKVSQSVTVKVVESVKPPKVEKVKETIITLPKVEKVKEVKKIDIALPKVIKPIKAISNEVVVPEVNVTIPSIPKIPDVNVSKVTPVKSVTPLTVKSMAEFESNSQMLDRLRKEQNLKDEALNQVKIVAKKLDKELEKEKRLIVENRSLKEKIQELKDEKIAMEVRAKKP